MISIQKTVSSLLKDVRNNHSVSIDSKDKNDIPRCEVKTTVYYIVCGIVIMDDKILMMREAKKTCYGQWYLPAGKMEPRETIQEAVCREVKEETGLTVEVLSLLCVESMHGTWLRFTITARPIEGTLKTIDKGDKESLEALWFPIETVLSRNLKLRALDILPLIRLGRQWFNSNMNDSKTHILPRVIDHQHCKIRLLLLRTDCDDSVSLFVLQNPLWPKPRLPEVPYTHATRGIIVASHLAHQQPHWIDHIEFHGIADVEHSGKSFGESDGVRLTVVMEIKSRNAVQSTGETNYKWLTINDLEIKSQLFYIMQSKACVPLVHV